jgi:DNA-binding HxlR family transcriptional regulator
MTFEEFKDKIQSNYDEKNCPVTKVLELLNGKWTTRVIYELERHDSIRFGELKKSMPAITNAMLSGTLKMLEKREIVIRTQFNEVPLRVEYSLSEAGKEMLRIYYEMAVWGDKFL